MLYIYYFKTIHNLLIFTIYIAHCVLKPSESILATTMNYKVIESTTATADASRYIHRQETPAVHTTGPSPCTKLQEAKGPTTQITKIIFKVLTSIDCIPLFKIVSKAYVHGSGIGDNKSMALGHTFVHMQQLYCTELDLSPTSSLDFQLFCLIILGARISFMLGFLLDQFASTLIVTSSIYIKMYNN